MSKPENPGKPEQESPESPDVEQQVGNGGSGKPLPGD